MLLGLLLCAFTDVENAFLSALTSAGITYSSPVAAIAAGHLACGELDGGKTPADVAQDVMAGSVLDAYHSGFFTGAAIAAFCPQYSSAIGGS
jgi:hypothetical protein